MLTIVKYDVYLSRKKKQTTRGMKDERRKLQSANRLIQSKDILLRAFGERKSLRIR